jgi:REP element-mobilizing transposase RayT
MYHVEQVSKHRNLKESTVARLTCQLSKTGIYHTVCRGVNHCHLFESSEDYEKLLETLAIIRADLAFEVFSNVLMSNHVQVIV